MHFSKYNIFSKFFNSDDYFILNLLTGNADVLTTDEAKMVESGEYEKLEGLIEKGYFVDKDEEKNLFLKKYLDFLDNREKDEIQIFFVTNYSCNFDCSYCYQKDYLSDAHVLNTDIIDAFFSYIDKKFAGRRKYITIFGGEPLLDGEKNKINIEYIIENANRRGLEISIVTNGYNLDEYFEILSKAKIREIQVTLDGTEVIHNKRRRLKNKQKTFKKIVSGVEKCLKSNIIINLRVIVDRENIDNLPELASYCIEKGWTKLKHFKTQIGRNYNLHSCTTDINLLFTRVGLFEKLYVLAKEHTEVLEFHKPAFSIARFLFENGQLPDPLFDACPACKTEWAFDYTGKIYSCTATVGKAGEELGEFYPESNLNEELVEKWQERDITTISECKDCALQLACGGGCGSIAKNKGGKILAADCRPIKELLELGLALYLEGGKKNV